MAHEEDIKRTTRGLCKSINQSRGEEAGVECNCGVVWMYLGCVSSTICDSLCLFAILVQVHGSAINSDGGAQK